MKKHFNTKAIHEGHEGFDPDSMSVPIYQSVAYPYFDAKEAAASFSPQQGSGVFWLPFKGQVGCG